METVFAQKLVPGQIYKSKRITNKKGRIEGYVYFLCTSILPVIDDQSNRYPYWGMCFGFYGKYPMASMQTSAKDGNWILCTIKEFEIAIKKIEEEMKDIINL